MSHKKCMKNEESLMRTTCLNEHLEQYVEWLILLRATECEVQFIQKFFFALILSQIHLISMKFGHISYRLWNWLKFPAPLSSACDYHHSNATVSTYIQTVWFMATMYIISDFERFEHKVTMMKLEESITLRNALDWRKVLSLSEHLW